MNEEFVKLEVLHDAREYLDLNAGTNVERVAGCLRILLAGFLDRVIEDEEGE